MVVNGHMYGKKAWSRIVWESVWRLEDEEIRLYRNQIATERLLFQVIDKPFYLTWWIISDISRAHIGICEKMAKMVCEASLLKKDDKRLKSKSVATRFCDKCTLSIEESVNHIVMQCPFFEEDRRIMLNELSDLRCAEVNNILSEAATVFPHLMGKQPQNVDFEVMYKFWIIAASHISNMYTRAIAGR